MKPTNSLLATLLLAGTALAGDSCAPKGDCNDTSAISDYSTLRRREVGARNTMVRGLRHRFEGTKYLTAMQEWRMWLLRDGKPISYWHDVPLYPDESDHQVVNMVVEIPRWTNGKIEIQRKEPLSTFSLLSPTSGLVFLTFLHLSCRPHLPRRQE